MAYVYCAGPLFNPAERNEMVAIAEVLEEAGHTTFLPHRDGLEFARLQPLLITEGVSPAEAERVLERAIYSLDVYLVAGVVDAVVANLNGRVPDEGMVVEATIARIKGKPLVFYKSDVRSLLHGADNPLVRGLTDFEIVASICDIPEAVQRQLEKSQYTLEEMCQLGSTIQQLRQTHSFDQRALALALLEALNQ